MDTTDQAKQINRCLQGRGRGWGSAERIEQLGSYATDMCREPLNPKYGFGAHCRVRNWAVQIRRQSVIGPFIADFMCPQKGLIVEVDGHAHIDPAKDAWRDAKLGELGFRVFHVPNSEVMQNLEGICEGLLALLAEMPDRYERPHPNPSPAGEGLKEAELKLNRVWNDRNIFALMCLTLSTAQEHFRSQPVGEAASEYSKVEQNHAWRTRDRAATSKDCAMICYISN